MASQTDNSFFHQNLQEVKILIMVPHEDDEIMTAGAFAYNAAKCGANIYLMFSTNGDWKYDAEIRVAEAVNSARRLGINENNIFFLGYGDSVNNDEHNHIFYASKEAIRTASGHRVTYGTDKYPDYSFMRKGMHHEYIYSNYLEDIISVITEIKADLIICSDFDEHPDHKMLSLCFDRAMGIVLKRERGYHPEVWKRFAYSLAYTAVDDYSPLNNPETKKPCVGVTGKYACDLIDTSYYIWNSRIRIPVPYHDGKIETGILSKALLEHKSQMVITHAGRILNSDEVYWKRRTDSCSYDADVKTSSGIGTYLNDFMLYNVQDIDSVSPSFEDYCWRPEDKEKKAVFSWKTPQNIHQAVIYGSIDSDSKVMELKLSLSDGYEVVVKDIPNNGNPLVINLGKHDNVTSCELVILKAEGKNYGIAECEFYNNLKERQVIHPFCKILIDGNFAYKYFIDDSVDHVHLEMYRYDTVLNPQFEVVEGKSKIHKSVLRIDRDDKEIIIKGTVKGTDAWDIIVIKRLSEKEKERMIKKSSADKKYLLCRKKMLKLHNMLYMLKHQGLLFVVKRTFNNAVLPRLQK